MSKKARQHQIDHWVLSLLTVYIDLSTGSFSTFGDPEGPSIYEFRRDHDVIHFVKFTNKILTTSRRNLERQPGDTILHESAETVTLAKFGEVAIETAESFLRTIHVISPVVKTTQFYQRIANALQQVKDLSGPR